MILDILNKCKLSRLDPFVKIQLSPPLQEAWRGGDIFQKISTMEGTVYRHEKNRKTLRFTLDKNGYFLKYHQGVGWKEIFKNLMLGRWPVLGAKQERDAISHLTQLGVPTMKLIGYGQRGFNPARLESFIITAELANTTSLEDFCRHWARSCPSVKLKRALIAKVANIARLIHSNGMNHRDFYICHFLLINELDPITSPLYLIDLHRMQIRARIPKRWQLKDIAGLYFSSMDLGLTQRDFLWFIKCYSGKPLWQVWPEGRSFWQQVQDKANRLYIKVHGKMKYAI